MLYVIGSISLFYGYSPSLSVVHAIILSARETIIRSVEDLTAQSAVQSYMLSVGNPGIMSCEVSTFVSLAKESTLTDNASSISSNVFSYRLSGANPTTLALKDATVRSVGDAAALPAGVSAIITVEDPSLSESVVSTSPSDGTRLRYKAQKTEII